jgi:hypothetical protein
VPTRVPSALHTCARTELVLAYGTSSCQAMTKPPFVSAANAGLYSSGMVVVLASRVVPQSRMAIIIPRWPDRLCPLQCKQVCPAAHLGVVARRRDRRNRRAARFGQAGYTTLKMLHRPRGELQQKCH